MLTRNFILWLSTKPRITNALARRGMSHGFARRFVAGESLDETLSACSPLCAQGRSISLNHLGENLSTEAAARDVGSGYIRMLEQLSTRNLPGNISIKLTQLGLAQDKEFCSGLTHSIARRAAELGRTIEIDMEASAYTDLTLDIFEAVQRESQNVGIAIQAYLYRSENDVKRLEPLRPKIRLVKGAYREPKNIAYQQKSAVDANFRRLTTLLMEGAARGTFFPSIFTSMLKFTNSALPLVLLDATPPPAVPASSPVLVLKLESFRHTGLPSTLTLLLPEAVSDDCAMLG